MTRIVAYTYESDYHCVDCTRKRFGIDDRYLKRKIFKIDADENGINPHAWDNDSNPIHPVFDTNEIPSATSCCDCHAVITEPLYERILTQLEKEEADKKVLSFPPSLPAPPKGANPLALLAHATPRQIEEGKQAQRDAVYPPVVVYDNYEISGCIEEGGSVEVCLDESKAQFWTLYGHIHNEGVEAIADFKTRELAEQCYSRITGRRFAGSYSADKELRRMHHAELLYDALKRCAVALSAYENTDCEKGYAHGAAIHALCMADGIK